MIATGSAGIGTSLPGNLASHATVPRIASTGQATSHAHTGANHGKISVKTILSSPPIMDANTGIASKMPKGTAHGFNWSKWLTISGAETAQATRPVASASSAQC